MLTAHKEVADYFESTVKLAPGTEPKKVSNWIMAEVMAVMAERGIGIGQVGASPEQLAGMFALVEKGTISGKIAKQVFEEMISSGKSAEEIVQARGLVQISDEGELQKIVQEILAGNQQQVEQYKAGKEQVFGFFVGQVMKATRGKANPTVVNDLLKEQLSS